MSSDLEKILEVYLKQIQDLEDAAFQVLLETILDNAVGEQLDVIGRIVVLAREGFADDTYRERLRAKIIINRGSGTIPEIIEIISLLSGPGVQVEVQQFFPAAIHVIAVDVLAVGLGFGIGPLLQASKLGGVRAIFIFHQTDPVFAFDGAGGSKFDGGFFFATGI